MHIDVHVHEKDIPTTIILFKEAKCLVSYNEFPFQIYEHDDEIDGELKVIDHVDKSLEDKEILVASIISSEEHGNKGHGDIRNVCLVGMRKWDVDCWFDHEDPINATNIESLVAKDMNLHFPFQINLNSKFLILEK